MRPQDRLKHERAIRAWIISTEPGAVKRHEVLRRSTKPKAVSWDKIEPRDQDYMDALRVRQGITEDQGAVELRQDLRVFGKRLGGKEAQILAILTGQSENDQPVSVCANKSEKNFKLFSTGYKRMVQKRLYKKFLRWYKNNH